MGDSVALLLIPLVLAGLVLIILTAFDLELSVESKDDRNRVRKKINRNARKIKNIANEIDGRNDWLDAHNLSDSAHSAAFVNHNSDVNAHANLFQTMNSSILASATELITNHNDDEEAHNLKELKTQLEAQRVVLNNHVHGVDLENSSLTQPTATTYDTSFSV